ncbi:MAG: hypothetical protein IPN99_07870 [Bacteroidetes bacterium]|nr:hypothetical protein [Bacteroidota bacterium]
MKNKSARILLVVIIMLCMLGAGIYFFRVKLIANYIPGIEQIGKLEIKVDDDTSYIQTKLLITNNSAISIAVDPITYKISLFNKIYLDNKKYIGMKLPANGVDTIDFSLKIPYRIILQDLKKARKESDSASYSIFVSLQYSTLLGNSVLPIHKEAKLKLPQPPELELVGVDYQKIRLRYIRAKATIKITNHGPITLSIKKMNYTMLVSKQGKLSGDFNQTIKIKPYSETLVSLPIYITLKNSIKTAFQVLLNKDNYAYQFTLMATLEPSNPKKKPIQIHLTKNGLMELKK